MVAYSDKKINRKKPVSRILLPAAGIILCIIVAVLVLINFHIYKQKRELISKIKHYQNQIESIKKANQGLKYNIKNADNIDYLEKIAYEQLGEQKPGEQAVIFVAPEQKQKESDSSDAYWTGQFLSPLNGVGGWLQGFWNWIKSRF